MTREIKFRGKNAEEWYYGHLFAYQDTNGGTGSHFIIGQNAKKPSPIQVIPDTVGQFTGLYDKNGREIYEGDIVHLDTWELSVMQIIFMEGAFCLADYRGIFMGDIHYIQHDGINQCTILGNIYDNPELLKEE